MASNAVGNEIISRVVGYNLTAGDFSTVTPNLPQRIAILAEANAANNLIIDGLPTVVTSAKQAGDIYGYGSPIHSIMRILRPVSGGGVQGIPTVVYPIPEVINVAKVMTVTVTGTATKSATHYVKVAGRTSLDGQFYALNIVAGSSNIAIAALIKDAVNGVLGSPMSATSALNVATLTTKWKGETSNSVQVQMFTDGNDAGITYAISTTTPGSGIPSSIAEISYFGDQWNTILVNGFGTISENILQAICDFNGKPDPVAPTGRYAGTIMKPFIALCGTSSENDVVLADTFRDEVSLAFCPAPAAEVMHYEIAASYALLFAVQTQNSPHLDIAGRYLPDIPVAPNASLSILSDFFYRDFLVKNGCSTADVASGNYRVQDFVTTFHPEGEVIPQYRYCRNLMLDFNVRYGYYLLEQIHVVDHAIAADNDVVAVDKVVKPKQWKAVLNTYAEGLSKRNIIVDPSFMKNSLTVGLSTVNPDRLDTFFRYKRSGFVRISSTTAEAGFNFGTLN